MTQNEASVAIDGSLCLDWKHHQFNFRPKPCRSCRRPAFMTDETGTPCHKVCAEMELAGAATTRRSA